MDLIIKTLKENKYKDEITDLEDVLNNINNNISEKEKESIKNKITKLKQFLTGNNPIIQNNKCEINDLTDFFNQLDQDIVMQPWNKLPEFIRLDKIAEFAQEKYSDVKRQIKLKEYILEAYNNKKLKRAHFNYDSTIGKIKNITCLKYDSKKDTYNF